MPGSGAWVRGTSPRPPTRKLEIRLLDHSLPPGRYCARIFALSADPKDFPSLRDQLSPPFNASSVWTPVASWGLP